MAASQPTPRSGDLKPTFLTLGIVFPLLAIASVALRLDARRILRLKLGMDDYFIILGLVFAIGVTVDILLDSRIGNLGGHEDPNSPDFLHQVQVFSKTNWALQLLVLPCLGFTKISVLLFYKRIFFGPKFAILTWVFIGIIGAWLISFFFTFLFECVPVQANWDPTLSGKCINEPVAFTFGLVTDILTDAMILALPVYNVWNLHMPIPRRLAVISVFLLGGFVTIAGVIRLVFLIGAFAALKNPTDDISYNFSPAIYWSIIELNVGIISACLPTFRPLYRAYKFDSIVGSARRLLSWGTLGRKTSDIPTPDSVRLRSLDNSSKKSNFWGEYSGEPDYIRDESTITTINGVHVLSNRPRDNSPSRYGNSILLQNDIVQRSEIV